MPDSISSNRKPRVLSGVQPTGKLHIGNYIGAVSQWVSGQAEAENFFCVVDLHALTIPEAIKPKVLREKTLEVAAIYLACGIDPKLSTIFVQSNVHEHAELSWVLSCCTPIGWLERMTQFKVKSEQRESVGTGLLTYPALQAADILLYDIDRVPVGEDQRQHIEIARDIAQRFNVMFGETFVLPDAVIRKTGGARIMGLDDPTAKMSKSIGEIQAGHSIGVLDPPNVIKKAVMSAKTDSGREVDPENAGAGVLNLLAIYQAVTNTTPEQAREQFRGQGYGTLKKAVAEAVVEFLAPVQARVNEILTERTELAKVLDEGAERASAIAAAKLKQVYAAMGVGGAR